LLSTFGWPAICWFLVSLILFLSGRPFFMTW
jgi:hypothetical protein